MIVFTNGTQVKRILDSITTYQKHPDQIHLDHIAHELSQIRVYNPETDGFLLLFEYTSGLGLRIQQARQMVRMVLPLLMGDPNVAGIAFDHDE